MVMAKINLGCHMESPRVLCKWVSLRSRIRGGQDYLTDMGRHRRSVLDAPLNPNRFH